VTWPFAGEIRHRDSLGSDVMLRPGELNLMTSGRGVSHSEISPDTSDQQLHGLQLWVASPEATRHSPARFEHHGDLPHLELEGLSATLLVGDFLGGHSPARVDTPLLGVDLTLKPGTCSVQLDATFEHALMVVNGDVLCDDIPLTAGPLLYLGTGRNALKLSSQFGAHLVLLGGEPFEEELVMWWNFVGRSHDEIVDARKTWQQAAERFGHVVGHGDERIPAPPLPNLRLKPRRRTAGGPDGH